MVMSPVLVPTQDPALAAKQQIARISRRIIARNYGAIARILNIKVEPSGLVTVWFQDDDVDNKIVKMTIGDTAEYKEVSGGRFDSLEVEAVDSYLISYANSFGSRLDAIAKPKNCKIGTSCKGACIKKGDICRDLAVADQELRDINQAVTNTQRPIIPVEPDRYEGLNIRELKEEARVKGVLRYSYMTQDQLKNALRLYDEQPEYLENIRKGLQRAKDESTLKKVKTTEVGRALSSISPALGKQFNLVAAVGKKYENNPDEARVLALSVILSIGAAATKSVLAQRKKNIEEGTSEASAMARSMRGNFQQEQQDNLVFIVGGLKQGSGSLANNVVRSQNTSPEDSDWLRNEAKLIPVPRYKEGTLPAPDPIRAIGDNIVDGYKATIGSLLETGRGKESVALAARLFVQGSTFAEGEDGVKKIPAINILAAEDGGLVARDALEILRKMPKSPDSNGRRGSDIADRIHLVTMGTPYFGLSKPDVPEVNIMGDGDPWLLTPFTKGGSETKSVSDVQGASQSDYTKSSAAMDLAVKHLKSINKDRQLIDKESAQKALSEQRKLVDSSMVLDVQAEATKRALKAGVSIESYLADEEAMQRVLAYVESKKRRTQKVKGLQKELGVNTDSYLQGRLDALKKLKCKSGYIQRGAACQKKDPVKSNLPEGQNSSLRSIVDYGLPIASIAAIALTSKTVVDDVKKVSKRIEPGEIFLKAGEPVPKEVLDLYDKEFQPGDLIKRKSLLNGLYVEHYGIYAGEGKIIETYAEDKFGGSTLLKGDIGRPSESDGTRYVKVEDMSSKAKPPSREEALRLAESMVGIPIKFDGVETNCEAIARLITQKDGRTSQGEKLSWITKSIGKIAAMRFGGKNLDKGFSVQEVQAMLRKSKYDPVLVKAIFADSVAQRKEDIEKAKRSDSVYSDRLKGLRDPDQFLKIVEKTLAPLSGVAKDVVEQEMYKAYLIGAFGLVSTKPSRKDSEDLYAYMQGRLDALKKIKCKSGYIQRGAACQKAPTSPKEASTGERPSRVFFPFNLQGAAAGAFVLAAGYSTSEYLSDPSGYNVSIQRQYQDLLNSTGIRGLIPNIIGKASFSEEKTVFGERIDSKRARKGEAKSEEREDLRSTSEQNFVDSLRQSRKDSFYLDLADYDKKKHGDISPEEFAAIRDYGRPVVYNAINGTLRGNEDLLKTKVLGRNGFQVPLDQIKKEAVEEAALIEKALGKLPSFKEPTYRGLQLPDEVIQKTIETGEWNEAGFMSTTKDFNSTYPGNVVFEVKGQSGRDLSEIETLPNKEVLYPSGVKLRVAKYRKIEKLGRITHYFEMEEDTSGSKRKDSTSNMLDHTLRARIRTRGS